MKAVNYLFLFLLIAFAIACTAESQSLSSSVKQIDDDNDENDDEVALIVLRPTIEKWLRGERFGDDFIDVSGDSLKEIAGGETSQLEGGDLASRLGLRHQPSLIDVDGDGAKELAIRIYCAPVGNCQFRIFKKAGDGYRTLLKTLVGAVQTFKLKESRSNGYFDIETTSHADAFSGDISLYKFNGNLYEERECSTYHYSYLKAGKLYTRKKPLIKPVPCHEP